MSEDKNKLLRSKDFLKNGTFGCIPIIDLESNSRKKRSQLEVSDSDLFEVIDKNSSSSKNIEFPIIKEEDS